VDAREMSERRACSLIEAVRKTVRYRSRRPRDDALRGRLRELAAEQRRFGYRRLHVLLRAEGCIVNRKKTQRLYREEGLTVRTRKGRNRGWGRRRRSWSKRDRSPVAPPALLRQSQPATLAPAG
jgi:putative transposase